MAKEILRPIMSEVGGVSSLCQIFKTNVSAGLCYVHVREERLNMEHFHFSGPQELVLK